MKRKGKTLNAPISELISLNNKKALITGSGTGIGARRDKKEKKGGDATVNVQG